MLDDEDVIEVRHLPEDFLEDVETQAAPARAAEPAQAAPRVGTLEEQEAEAIRAALRQHAGNVSAAARALGVSRNTIYRRLGGLPPSEPQ
jgi:transcriptional regulator of acetoin/glycerol metabolism